MFKTESAPYLFTIIIATLGWLLTRAADEMTKSPLLAYSIQESVDGQGREYSVRVHNISAATALRNVYLILTNLDGKSSKFTRAEIQYEAPIHISKERKTAAEHESTWAGVLVKELQPKTAIRLTTVIEGPDTPVLRCESATDTIRLIEDGCRTFVVEQQTAILLWLAGGLCALLLIYVVYLVRNRPTAAAPVAIAAVFVLTSSELCSAATIQVIDEVTGRGVQSDIYREDGNAERRRVGKTSPNGVYRLAESGKSGEKYVALSEEYNPGSVECPLTSATIRVRKTAWLKDHIAKAEFLRSAQAPAAAALEFRKAALIAEKKQNTVLFNQLEYHVVETTARALDVDKPFVETPGGIRSSVALKDIVQKYQRSRDLKPTGALNSDTIRDIASITKPPETRMTANNYIHPPSKATSHSN
jgi:hypothetical protein